MYTLAFMLDWIETTMSYSSFNAFAHLISIVYLMWCVRWNVTRSICEIIIRPACFCLYYLHYHHPHHFNSPSPTSLPFYPFIGIYQSLSILLVHSPPVPVPFLPPPLPPSRLPAPPPINIVCVYMCDETYIANVM